MARTLSLPCLFLALIAAPMPASAEPPTVAVAHFDNRSGNPDNDALGRGLADMLITDLSQLSSLRIVERGQLSEVLAELDLAQTAFIDPATAASLGQGLGAQVIVTGSFVTVDPEMRIDARVVDVATAEVRFATSATGPTSEFFLLEKELAMAIAAEAGAEVSFREQARLGQAATESFQAFSAWSRSLEALDRGAVDDARDELQKALAHDDGFTSAMELLQQLQQRLDEYGEVRGKLLDEQAVQLLARLDEIDEAGGPYDEIPRVVDVVGLGSDVKRTRAGQAVASRLLDMRLPESLEFELLPGKAIAVNEWALWWYAHTSLLLGDRIETLSYGEAFLDRYPTSMYASGVSTYLQGLSERMRQEEAGRAQVPRIRAEGERVVAEIHCRQERQPDRRIVACEEWVSLLNEAGEPREEALRHTVRGFQAAGDLERLEGLRESYPAAPGVDRAIGSLSSAQEKAAEVLTEGFESARDARTASRTLARAGRYSDVIELTGSSLAIWPDEVDLHEERVEAFVALGDIEGAEDALAAWSEAWTAEQVRNQGEEESEAVLARWRASTSHHRTYEEVADLAEDLDTVAAADAKGLLFVGRELSAAHQYLLAAETYVDLAHRFPAFDSYPEVQALFSAAGAYRSADALADSRALYQDIADRFADTTYGESSRLLLQTMPE